MKKLLFSLVTAVCFFLAGCLETTQELTLNNDGSGTFSTTSDMSAAIGIAKQMGGAAEMEKAPAMDTSFSLQKGADSMSTLNAEERALARTGTMKVKMDTKEEKAFTVLSFPFSKPSQVSDLTKLTGKVMGEAMEKQMKEQIKEAPPMAQEMPETSSMDDYYNLEFSEGELTRKVNKSKYAGVESDEYLKGLKQATSMGMT